jgi:hypothetical protein
MMCRSLIERLLYVRNCAFNKKLWCAWRGAGIVHTAPEHDWWLRDIAIVMRLQGRAVLYVAVTSEEAAEPKRANSSHSLSLPMTLLDG